MIIFPHLDPPLSLSLLMTYLSQQAIPWVFQVLRLGSPADGIHLQSCGDLNSTSPLRRLLSGRRLDQRRPCSLSGLLRESNL